MSKAWIVMDEGCQHCDVQTKVVGVFRDEELAKAAKTARLNNHHGYRNGGMCYVYIYKIKIPKKQKVRL